MNRMRGFALLQPEERTQVARKGGASVPNEKRSFSTNRELAKEAGRKGGAAGRGPRKPKGATGAAL